MTSNLAKRRNSSLKIKTWRERCDDLGSQLTGDIQRFMQEEIDELREALTNAAPQDADSARAAPVQEAELEPAVAAPRK